MYEWLMPGIPRTIAEDPSMETVRRIRASVTSDTGQVVESDLLLPCPFCGGRPYVQTYELDETCVEARVVCPSCHVSTTREYQSWKVGYLGDDLTRTLAIGRAISGWNRRADRTCRVESSHEVDVDALLALADEIEDNDVTYCVSTQYVLDEYARRIREALGVSDD